MLRLGWGGVTKASWGRASNFPLGSKKIRPAALPTSRIVSGAEKERHAVRSQVMKPGERRGTRRPRHHAGVQRTDTQDLTQSECLTNFLWINKEIDGQSMNDGDPETGSPQPKQQWKGSERLTVV